MRATTWLLPFVASVTSGPQVLCRCATKCTRTPTPVHTRHTVSTHGQTHSASNDDIFSEVLMQHETAHATWPLKERFAVQLQFASVPNSPPPAVRSGTPRQSLTCWRHHRFQQTKAAAKQADPVAAPCHPAYGRHQR